MSIVFHLFKLNKTNHCLQPKDKVRVKQALMIIGLAFLFSFQSCGAGVQNNNSVVVKNNEVDLADQQTGFFEIKYSSKYEANGLFIMDSNENNKYLIGKWRNPERTKTFDIKFTEEIPVINN